MVKHPKPDYLYDINDSGVTGDIGKVQYLGESSIGQLTDGKVYNCIGVAYCKIRIIDDSGTPYYYDADRPSSKYRDAKFVVVEDNSTDKILTAFVDGKETRTPKEKDLERRYVTWFFSVSMERDNSRQRIKPHCHRTEYKQIGYLERTPERDASEKKMFENFSKAIAPLIFERIKAAQKEMELEVLARDGYKCVLCSSEPSDKSKLYVREIDFPQKEKQFDASDYRTLCLECGVEEMKSKEDAKKKK